jgi:outer membrane protein insertion porin family
MLRLAAALTAIAGVAIPAFGQPARPASVGCSVPDSVAVRGNARISAVTIRTDAGIGAGQQLDVPTLQRAIRDVMRGGNFDDVAIDCDVRPDGKQILIIEVAERPVLTGIDVQGADKVSRRTVQDRVTLQPGRALDPAALAKSVAAIDSLYEDRGYYLARVRPETTIVASAATIVFHIDEGRRLAVSGVTVEGNDAASDKAIVAAMKTRPEGFLWWRRGEFDDDVYRTDLSLGLPDYYGRRGYIDFTVVEDTLVVSPDLGKAEIRFRVDEGRQYRVGSFEVVGNRHFSSEDLARFFPFRGEGPSLTERVTAVIKRDRIEEGVFDRSAWEAATSEVQGAYMNEGYLSAQIRPVIERVVTGPDSVPTANLRWEIVEGPISIVNRVDIIGNDYTNELCIRDQLSIFPGSVFNRDRLIRSYQQIANLGFFETPLPEPSLKQSGDQGDVDIIFNVTEKRTGNVNFGASVGQGVGVGGFIGLDQPNLFGQCKRGSLQWQFGGLINDFNLSYTDPAIERSNFSGKVDAYHTRSRYLIRDFGRQVRTGGALRLGFPIAGSIYSRMFISYGGEAVRYGRDEGSLLGQLALECDNCFRSTLGSTLTRDTRLGLPFATAGSLQNFDAQFNGGPLGGTAKFQRYTTELRSYAPMGRFGGDGVGATGVEFSLGLTVRAGTVFGDTGPFFPFQEFAMGGTQQGEQLRGYEEFTITPRGFVPEGSSLQATRESFGKAFLSTTAEVGARVSQQLYFSLFYDAGNVWDHPREIDPTRLFRGAGVGMALITPLGPLGLDWAYGFDRLNDAGRPDPRWKLHFKLGQLF